VRALLAHEDWQVRVQAAKALGRIGDRGDTERLVALLADREWWVRYRAAQALVELPWLTRADLDALHAALDDRYAADMLAQVMAEIDAANDKTDKNDAEAA
jgi:HEAT repeat protein